MLFIQFGYQENEFLHDVLSFTPKKIGEGKLSNEEKVCYFLVSCIYFRCLDLLEICILWPYPNAQSLLTKQDFAIILLQRLFKSPNSALNKARTQFLTKQRMLAKVS